MHWAWLGETQVVLIKQVPVLNVCDPLIIIHPGPEE